MNTSTAIANRQALERQLSAADTAHLVRAALRESFPGVGFSVVSRTYADDASIFVIWTDDPAAAQVEKVASVFAGTWFDPLFDYKGRFSHTLDGQPVRVGADFINCHRTYSDAAIGRACELIFANHYEAFMKTTLLAPTVNEFREGVFMNTHLAIGAAQQEQCLHTLVYDELRAHTSTSAAQPSATLQRLRITRYV